MVEGQRDIGACDVGRDGLGRRYLELVDEVLVRCRGESLTLFRVQEDVVTVQLKPGGAHGLNGRTGLARPRRHRRRPPELLEFAEIDHDAHGMRLERNKRQRGTDVVAEPEPEGNAQMYGICGYTDIGWIDRPVSDHFIVAVELLGRRRELIPDMEPLPRVFVKLLFADFDADVFNERVTDVIHPVVRRCSFCLRKWRQLDFDEE